MKEINLRKYHRYMGVTIALLVIFQVGTGLILSLNAITGSAFLGSVIPFIHLGDGTIGNVYRIVLATALLSLVATGVWIYMKMLGRSMGAHPKRAATPAAQSVTPEEREVSLR